MFKWKEYWSGLEQFYTLLAARIGAWVGAGLTLLYLLDAIENRQYLRFVFLISLAVLLMIARYLIRRNFKDWLYYMLISLMVAAYAATLAFGQNVEFIFWENIFNLISKIIGSIMMGFLLGLLFQIIISFKKYRKLKIDHDLQKAFTIILAYPIYIISNAESVSPLFSLYLINVGKLVVVLLPLFALRILFK